VEGPFVLSVGGSLERGGDVLQSRGQARYPRARRRRSAFSRVGSLPSSEAEAWGAVEGFGGEHPAGPRGVQTGRTTYVGRVLGFFESFPFFQIRRGLQAFVGPVAQYAFVFRAISVL